MEDVQRLLKSAARDCVLKDRSSFVQFQASTGVEVQFPNIACVSLCIRSEFLVFLNQELSKYNVQFKLQFQHPMPLLIESVEVYTKFTLNKIRYVGIFVQYSSLNVLWFQLFNSAGLYISIDCEKCILLAWKQRSYKTRS